MRTFEKFFRNKVSYDMIDKYVNLVLKTLDPDMRKGLGSLVPIYKNFKK